MMTKRRGRLRGMSGYLRAQKIPATGWLELRDEIILLFLG
jgi:hypothetical protein